jgi:hypothetical protein
MTFKTLAKSLAQSLKQRRQDLGISQSRLDDILGHATGVVAKWEGGFRSPTGFHLYCWAAALGCDLVLVPRPEKIDADRSGRSRRVGRSRQARDA